MAGIHFLLLFPSLDQHRIYRFFRWPRPQSTCLPWPPGSDPLGSLPSPLTVGHTDCSLPALLLEGFWEGSPFAGQFSSESNPHQKAQHPPGLLDSYLSPCLFYCKIWHSRELRAMPVPLPTQHGSSFVLPEHF